jgi:hypothetical protein
MVFVSGDEECWAKGGISKKAQGLSLRQAHVMGAGKTPRFAV